MEVDGRDRPMLRRTLVPAHHHSCFISQARFERAAVMELRVGAADDRPAWQNRTYTTDYFTMSWPQIMQEKSRWKKELKADHKLQGSNASCHRGIITVLDYIAASRLDSVKRVLGGNDFSELGRTFVSST